MAASTTGNVRDNRHPLFGMVARPLAVRDTDAEWRLIAAYRQDRSFDGSA